MRSMLLRAAVVSLLLAAAFPLAGRADPARGVEDPLAAGFARPPKSAKPSIYWLWLNGYVNRDYVDEELKQFRDQGVGGILIFDMGARGDERATPPAGPAFMSDESVENIAHAINIAKKYDLDVQLAACSSWDLGGDWVAPPHASMGLYRAEIRVDGPSRYSAVLPLPALPKEAPRTPDGEPAFFKDIAVLALPERAGSSDGGDGGSSPAREALSPDDAPPKIVEDRSQIIDLTGQLGRDGRLEWSVPPGRWTLMRFVCANTGERLKVPSPNSDGLATDHFSSEATRAFLERLIRRLEERLGDLGKSAIAQLYLPSYEVRGAQWTPDFIAQFQQYRGYDMTPFLPTLAGWVIENDEVTNRFLFDYRKTLGDLLVDAYYRTASEVAGQAGLGVEAEAGGPGPPVHQVPVDALKALGAIDEMRGEFWPWRMDRDEMWVVKETACAAHIYGRRRVHMEAFTGFRHWQDGPFDLKPSADRAFCEGMNHVVWHTATHQPPESGRPGWVYGAGSHLTPNLAWWSKAKPFLEYLARCSFLLQQGRFVGDVCYYYGDQGFNFVPPKHVDPSLGYGYDYDVANPEAIRNRMSVRDGRITLPDGVQYELLVLPDREDMDLDVLRKLEQLVKAGATVVGRKPSRSGGLTDYPHRDRRIRELADALWGNCDGEKVLEHRHGAGKIVWGRSLRSILEERGIGPDFHYASEQGGADLDFIHRRTADADIYFIRNKTMQPASVTGHFRVSGKSPELWIPESGEIVRQLVYERTSRGVRTPLEFGPAGSVFVVFRKPDDRRHLTSADPGIQVAAARSDDLRVTAWGGGSYELKTSQGRTLQVEFPKVPAPKDVAGPWTVRFLEGPAAPDELTLAKLESWTENELFGVRCFSGTARYETEFDAPGSWLSNGRRVFLDLGRLWAVGEVTLNGRPLGVLWRPPYRVEITGVVRADGNRLEIEIANTWANRLVGDALSPENQRVCRTNITGSGTPRKSWKEIPLRESGLLGPVRLIPAFEKMVSLSK